ncbi:MAG: VTT domain-containing protein [Candidatus Limnocylindria bacterium]
MLGGPARGVEAAQRFALGALHPRALARAGRTAHPVQKVAAVLAVVAINVALFVAPFDYTVLGALAYPGAFLVTLIANAAVVVPVPYIPIVAHIAQTAGIPALVVLAAASGSALGECVAFAVGRVEKDLFEGHAWVERIRRFFAHPRRTALFLFFFAIPLNPVFDVGGLGAGALGVPFRTFLVAVWLGRLVRFSILAYIAIEFGLL